MVILAYVVMAFNEEDEENEAATGDKRSEGGGGRRGGKGGDGEVGDAGRKEPPVPAVGIWSYSTKDPTKTD